jgi:enoyl-CoA hydratase/carnithine racemase
MHEHVKINVTNRIGFISLDRPKALNSLSLEMVRAITESLLAWREDTSIQAVVIGSASERAFCAGGDIRFFHECGSATPKGGSALLEDFFTEEYALNYLIHHYPKPYIAIMNGIVMGGGMGIAQSASAGRVRIVTESTKMAMPEVQIGLFPDVGGSYFLSRAPGMIGTYLGVTGETISAADALYSGLADAFIPTAELARLIDMLKSTTEADLSRAIHDFAIPYKNLADPAESKLAKHRASIERHFAASDVPSIMAALHDDVDPFAQNALTLMRQRSPLMMCVTLEQIRRASTLDIAECLRMERTMVRRNFEHGEVLEGVRALVIDKDNAPRWSPSSVDSVTRDMVEHFFQPAWPAYAHPLRDLN